jgi:uncharacterized membrane protein (UPF0127 family)
VKEFGFQVIGILAIIFGTMFAIFNPSLLGINFLPGGGNRGSQSHSINKIEIVSNDGKTVKATVAIELADTPDKRGVGLGGRNSLDQKTGMLFLFSQPGVYNFWMKGMKFPLDFIWIYSDQVVDTKSDVPPPANGQTDLPLYHANRAIDKVLEVNAGFVKAHNITPGDLIKQLN